MEDEYEKKLRKVTKSQQQEEQGRGEFELPTGQIQNVLGEIARVAKEYHIILPPPFSPFDSLPRLPAATKPQIEDLPEAPPRSQTEKEAIELTAGDMKAVEILAREGLSSDRIAATLKIPIKLVLGVLIKTEEKLREPGSHTSSSYSRRGV